MRAIKGRWASNYADQGKAPQLSDEKSLTKPLKELSKSNQIKPDAGLLWWLARVGGWGRGLSLSICNNLLKSRQ